MGLGNHLVNPHDHPPRHSYHYATNDPSLPRNSHHPPTSNTWRLRNTRSICCHYPSLHYINHTILKIHYLRNCHTQPISQHTPHP
jgi:hypothetical protein